MGKREVNVNGSSLELRRYPNRISYCRDSQLLNSILDPFFPFFLTPFPFPISPKLTLSVGSSISITLHAATQARRPLALSAVGLPSSNESHPMDHDSVSSGHTNIKAWHETWHETSQSPALQKAEVPASVEDDVIQQGDAHDNACRLELRRHLNVGRRRLKATGALVMRG